MKLAKRCFKLLMKIWDSVFLCRFYQNQNMWRDSTEVEKAPQDQEVPSSNPAWGEIFWISSFSASFFPLPGEDLSFLYRETWIVFPLLGDLKSSIFSCLLQRVTSDMVYSIHTQWTERTVYTVIDNADGGKHLTSKLWTEWLTGIFKYSGN